MIRYLSDIEFRSYGRKVIWTFTNKKMMIEGAKMESNDMIIEKKGIRNEYNEII